MKKFLTKIAIYTFFILLIGNGVAWLSLYFIGKSNLYKPQFVKNGLKETHFDYVVLGSSTGLTTLDTKLIDEKLKTNGLNISMDDSALSSHYLMMQFFYQQKKTTDYLVLAVTPWDLANDNPKINNNDYRFLSEYNTKEVKSYYNSISYEGFPVLKYATYFPLIGVSYYNTELFYPSLFTILKPEKRNRFDEKGNYSYPNMGSPKSTEATIKNLKVNNSYFQKIKDFCQGHGIKLIVYQSPLYKTTITSNSKENFVNHSNFITVDSLFYDNLHVNSMGRTKCSEDFAIQFNTIRNRN